MKNSSGYLSWIRPDLRVRRRTVVMAVLSAGVAAGLAACSSAPADGPPPSVASGGPREFSPELRAFVACMADGGWTVKPGLVDGGETYGLGYSTDQADQAEKARATCTKSSGFGSDAPTVTAQSAGKDFDDLQRTAHCLEALGISVPAAPSRQSFIDAAVRGSSAWDVYGNAPTAGLDETMASCPIGQS